MNREPIGLYILRFVLALGLFAFMAMLYWSSVLIEEDIRSVNERLVELRQDLATVNSSNEKNRDEILSALGRLQVSGGREQQKDKGKTTSDFFTPVSDGSGKAPTQRQQMDSKLPNLLTEDPYYSKTLPSILPKNFKPQGMRKMAIVGTPDNLHPFSNWSHVSSWVGQCSVSVATMHFGHYETMAPDMAVKMEERKDSQGRPEFWVHLRDNVFWHTISQELVPAGVTLAPHFSRKHQVTAEDFKFYFDAVMNPWVQQPGAVALRPYLQDIEEFRVVDKLTFVVRWKTDKVTNAQGQIEHKVKYIAKGWTGNLIPLASFLYKYFADGTKIISNDTEANAYRTNSVWAQNFNQHWARNVIPSCGPWIFTGMTDRQITFKRNPDYYLPLAVLVEGMEVDFKETPEAIWQDFKAGKLDTYELRPDELAEYDTFLKSPAYQEQAAAGLGIKRLDYVDRSFSYIGWNEAKVFFKDAAIRRALTMAIDRQRIIRQNLNGMGVEITGPLYRYSKNYDASIPPYPYDPVAARHILESEGWYDSDGDGIIDKTIGGKIVPFRLSLTYFVKSPTAKAIGEYVAQALKEVEIGCDLNGVDIADLSATFDDKNFDAIQLAWSQGSPPEEPKQLWYSTGAREKGSSNAIGFANPEIDKIIDQLQYEYNPQKRIELYHRFDQVIHEEAPYTFLYTPKAALIYRDYVQNVFIPADSPKLVPDSDVAQPQANVFWLKEL